MSQIHTPNLLKNFRTGAYNNLSSLDFGMDELLAAERSAEHPDDRFDLLRLRGWYHFLRQKYDLALAAQLEAFALRPSLEGIKNIGIVARLLRDQDHAISFLLKEEQQFSNKFEFYDVLAHNCGIFGDAAAARRFGTRSLELKHASYGGGIERPVLPPVPAFRPDPIRNIIAFSLFGTAPRYVQPLLTSADLRPHLYPLWTLRIYVDGTVPQSLRELLRTKGCQVEQIDKFDLPGTFWRFLVAEDKTIDRFLVRDADSILNIRERVAVDAWIASGRHFHLMRDFYSHSELILAGLWGGVRGGLSDIRNLATEWLGGRKSVVYNQTTVDQIFLREKIWRIVRHSALIHDSVFNFGDKSDFPLVGTLPPWRHVGQDDFIFFKKASIDNITKTAGM